jgi:hypothetical protein
MDYKTNADTLEFLVTFSDDVDLSNSAINISSNLFNYSAVPSNGNFNQ